MACGNSDRANYEHFGGSSGGEKMPIKLVDDELVLPSILYNGVVIFL